MTSLSGFLLAKLIKTLLIWTLLVVFIGKVQAVEKLLQIELIEKKKKNHFVYRW